MRIRCLAKITFGWTYLTVNPCKPPVKKMIEIIQTLDGTHSLRNSRLDETYHSANGAQQESAHVFIAGGINYIREQKTTVRILEMGFGTGLNALLTLHESSPQFTVNYTGIEAFPVATGVLAQLNYAAIISPGGVAYYPQLAAQPFNTTVQITPYFSLQKVQSTFEAFVAESVYDLIYYDAFGPKIQPELWTMNCMQKCYDLLAPGGVLVTYCAQGQFKRHLKQAGFAVYELPGPPGKWQMTRAVK